MSENSATRSLRGELVSTYGAHVQRFEDKLTPGIPDMNASWEGLDVWLEGKFIKALPARRTTQIRFGGKDEPRLAHQCNWLAARYKAGGLAFFWFRIRDGGWYLSQDFQLLKTGITFDQLDGMANLHSAKGLAARLNEHVESHKRIWL